MILFTTGWAQTTAERITVRGKVTDRGDKQPIIGASVVELDKDGRTVAGVSTDIDGNFALRVSNPNNSIAVSFIGYKTFRQAIGGRTTLNIQLAPSANELTEVAITARRPVNNGTGLNIDARNSTVATATVQAKDLEELGAQSIDQALQGRLPGVDFGTSSGDPGAGMSIRIRGTASINGSSDPLIVLDGMPYETQIPEDFNFGTADEQGYAQLLNIAPTDIRDITVLKDAASTAVWGARAANGVLIINTKRGAIGKPQVTYNFKGSLSRQPNAIPMLSGNQFSMLVPEMYANRDGLPLNIQQNKEFQYDPNDPYWYHNYSNNTDWIDQITRIGHMQDHNVSMTGGGEKARYYASVGYVNQLGTTIGTDLSRISSKINLDYNVSSRIRFRTDISYTHVNNTLNYTDKIREVAYNKMPNMAVYEYDEYGNQTPNYFSPLQNIQGRFGFDDKDKVTGTFNPLAMAREGSSRLIGERIVPHFFLQYDILPSWITSTFDLQFDINNTKSKTFLPQVATGRLTTEPFVNRATDSDGDAFTVSSKLNFVFTPRLSEKHTLSSLLSIQTNDNKNYGQFARSSNTASSFLQDPSIPSRLTNPESRLTSTVFQRREIGVLVNGQYGYLDRYLINAGLRLDGNSRFGPANRYGLFPSISTRWRISGEPFMRRFENFLDDLSLRASYGHAGKAPGKDYLFYNLYQNYDFNYLGMSGVFPSNMELTNLRWETLVGKNLGLNLWMFKNRVKLDAEVYKNSTRDLLYDDLQISSFTGFDKVTMNVGTIDNQGWEVSLNTIPVKTRNLTVGFDLNIARNINVVRSVSEFYPKENAARINENGKYKTYLQIGNPFGSYYGFKFKGVYKDQDATIARDKNGNQIIGPNNQIVYMRFNYPLTDYTFQPGDAMYEDINNDGNINYMDMVYLGNGIPKFTGGFGPTFTYKGNWKLNMFFSYRYDYDLVNATRMKTTNMWDFNNQSTEVLSRWRNPGDETIIPRALYRSGFNWLGSDRYVEDASFVRLRSVTLRYNFTKQLLSKLKVKSSSFYVTAENLYTWTNYTGQDPDVSIRGNNDPFKYPEDNSLTPPGRTILMGVTVGF
ncbi:SusC/RagA family TonB-linked outer membrane protein [Pedobacter sp. SYSU D00535]|uniref:SusC/RagA family TonB-linked outer membrane protein n=1 Tax=Pedobacter sp. SYSU D00535 TaxID=2810308 RepID=UPI001F617483|nr:SusC/RagA family TonB-linked outer membrane protein [Pedobacter sp. SYSU D00535]